MIKFEKSYDPAEFFYRFDTFKTTMDFVDNHNKGNHTYTVGLNAFADMSSGEFKARMLGYKPELVRGKRVVPALHEVPAPQAYPDGSLDWSQKGAVTGVKNQGNCGSCWAFSTTGGVEGVVAIQHGMLISLSEQELVDCADSYGNMGCNGGSMDSAFKYVEANGLCTESAYPYTSGSTDKAGTCQKSSCGASSYSKITGYTNVVHTENALGAAVDIEPISVAIEADQPGFQYYTGGVFSGVCGQNLDHGVLTVGYGTDNTYNPPEPYWKVKNSWGTSWGEAGYIRIIRNQDECGIANEPSYPTEP
jgi:C1A family cysteine protease